MTKRGVGFLLFIALLLILALTTGSSEIFLAVFITGQVFAFALVSAAAGVFALHVTFSLSDNSVSRCEHASISVFCKGTVVLPLILRVKLILPGGNPHQSAAQLWGIRHKPLSFLPVCQHRGIWETGVRSLHSCDIFGFFSVPVPRSRYAEAMGKITVYPSVFDILGLPPAPVPTVDYIENNPVTADHGDSFAETRLYRDGDPLKRIHWKLSIRTHELHTRKYEMSVDRMVAIVIDTSSLPEEPSGSTLNYADMATECAASLGFFYSKSGHKVRIYPAYGSETALICTEGDFRQAHTMLALLPFGARSSVDDYVSALLKDLSYFSAIHVVARTRSPRLIGLLSDVTALGCHSTVIYPDETEQAPACEITENDIRLIAITRPQDISERLGACI